MNVTVASLPLAPCISRRVPGVVLIPTRPVEVTRSLSLPAVVAVIVSAEGKRRAVSVSPVWKIESAIDTLRVTVKSCPIVTSSGSPTVSV